MNTSVNKNDISLKYKEAYLYIINHPDLTTKSKSDLVEKLIKSMVRATKQADRQLKLNKNLQKIDLDKVAGVEMLVASLFPVMASMVLTWGLGPVQNKELYNKVVEIMMDEVLKISAVGAFLGLPTTIFEEKIKKNLQTNVDKATEKKEAIASARKEIENALGIDELTI